MTSNFSFSSPVVEKIVLLVQSNPVLYNTLDTNYENISLKDSIWKDISLKIEKPVDDIKQTWQNIRDSYSRIVARKLELGSAFNIKKLWILAHRLSFLDQDECDQQFHKEEGLNNMPDKTAKLCDWSTETVITNRSISKFNQIENVPGNSNKPSTLNQNTQMENEKLSTEEIDQLDDIEIFFQNLTLKAKQFPSNGRIEVKMKICTLLNELQEKYLVCEPPLHPRRMQPIYLFTNVHIPSEQNDFSSSSSIQSCASTVLSFNSDSEFSNSESIDD